MAAVCPWSIRVVLISSSISSNQLAIMLFPNYFIVSLSYKDVMNAVVSVLFIACSGADVIIYDFAFVFRVP